MALPVPRAPFTINGDFAAAFHTYGMDWDASHLTFYVDGNPFFTLTKAQVEATRGPWVYDHPVDYVRVFQ
jgi:beta-glucanase (GH16 family)